MNKGVIGLVALLIIVGGIFFVLRGENNSTGNVVSESCGEDCELGIDSLNFFNLNEIAKHNSKENCWMAIDGKVYDATEFIALGKHKSIDSLCGTDITEKYSHDKSKLNKLELIGDLK